MKNLLNVSIVLLLLLLATGIVGAQKNVTPEPEWDSSGVSVTCDDGTSFNNGIEVTVIQMRTGFSYTATALGIDGFDPVLSVLGEDGRGLCTDDESLAAQYEASLPTTGYVGSQPYNSQIFFSNTGADAFADISLVVGGYGDQPGEFLLILEKMYVTDTDGAGDPFSLRITDAMIASGVPVTAYVIANTNDLDPYVSLINPDYETLLDDEGNAMYCDDGGNVNYCWSEAVVFSETMDEYYVTIEADNELRYLSVFPTDAILIVPLFEEYAGKYLNFLVTSSPFVDPSYGPYTLVFHIGIGEKEEEKAGKAGSGG